MFDWLESGDRGWGRPFFCVVLAWCCLLNPSALPALDWHAEQGFRWAELDVPRQGKPGFTLMSPDLTGIRFTNELDEAVGAANRVLYNGAGVAVGDYDKDGLPDIFLCNLSGKNALYKNLGNWHFKDVTAE